MKLIQVSDEEYKQLMEIARELNTQDNCGTADPFWFLFDKQKLPTSSTYSDKYLWHNSDWEASEEEVQELLKDKKDDFTKEYRKLEKESKEFYPHTDEVDLHRRVMERMGYEQVFYTEVATCPKGVFFTEKACKAWAKANRHHLSSQAYNFVASLWRNAEMQLIRKILLTLEERIKNIEIGEK